MSVLTIPIPAGEQIYRQQLFLDGKTYILDFQFNGRDGFWYFDLMDQDGQSIRNGIKIVTGFPLLAGYQHAARPPGEFIAVDATGQGIEPNTETLGSGVVLTYVEAGA